MQKTLSRKGFAVLLTLMLTLPIMSIALITPVQAVGTSSVWPTKFKANVDNAFWFSGSGYTPTAALYYYVVSEGLGHSGALQIGAPVGVGKSVDAKATTTGAIPEYAFGTKTWVSTGSDAVFVSEYTTNPPTYTPVTVTIVDSAPSIDSVSSVSGKYGDTITIKGSGFTPNGAVNIYWNTPNRQIKSATADADGNINVDITVPECPQGTQAILVYDVSAGILATYSSENYISVTVSGLIVPDRFSISGSTTESFAVNVYGFATLTTATIADKAYEGKTIGANTLTVGGTATVHSSATASDLGTATITSITLQSAIDPATASGPKTLSITTPLTATGSIFVSKPQLGLETIKLYKSATSAWEDLLTGADGKKPDASLTVAVYNFPAGIAVTIKIAGITLGTVATDSNGAGKATFTVPEITAATYSVVATYSGRYDTATLEILKYFEISLSGKYVDKGTEITVTAKALDPDTAYYPVEYISGPIGDAQNIILAPSAAFTLVTGSLGADGKSIKPNSKGTIVFKYATFTTATSTGQTIYVELCGSGYSSLVIQDSYRGIITATLSISGTGLASVTSGVYSFEYGSGTPTVTVSLANLVSEKYYQLLLDNTPVPIEEPTTYKGKNYFSSIGTGTVKFVLPALAQGVHTLAIVYKGSTTALATVKIVSSTTTGTPTLVLSKTSVTYGKGDIEVIGYNFPAGTYTIKVSGTTISVPSGTVTSPGVFCVTTLSTAFDNVPKGQYMLFVKDRTEPTTQFLITVSPTISVSGSVSPGSSVTVSLYNLEVTTRYDIYFDDQLIKSITTGIDAKWSGQVTIPDKALPGTHTIKVYLADTTSLEVSKSITVVNAFTLTPNPEAIAGQLVQFDWNIGAAPSEFTEPVYVTVFIDDSPVTTVKASPYVSAGQTHLVGSFQMPNGNPDVPVKITLAYEDSRKVSQLFILSSSGTATPRFEGYVDEEHKAQVTTDAYTVYIDERDDQPTTGYVSAIKFESIRPIAVGSGTNKYYLEITKIAGASLPTDWIGLSGTDARGTATLTVSGNIRYGSATGAIIGTFSGTLKVTVNEVTADEDKSGAGNLYTDGTVKIDLYSLSMTFAYGVTAAPTVPSETSPITTDASNYANTNRDTTPATPDTTALTITGAALYPTAMQVDFQGYRLDVKKVGTTTMSSVVFVFEVDGTDASPATISGLSISGDIVSASPADVGDFHATLTIKENEGTTPNQDPRARIEGKVSLVFTSISLSFQSALITADMANVDSDLMSYSGNNPVTASASVSAANNIYTNVLVDAHNTDSTDNPAVIKRISGAGSLLIGVDLANDIAYIKGTVSNITVSLSELNATVVAINETVVTIDTKFGTMSAKLDDINATLAGLIIDAKGEVLAAINTALGNVTAKLNDLNATLVSLANDAQNNIIAEIWTAAGNVTAHIDSLDLVNLLNALELKLDNMNATLVSVKDGVAEISLDIGDIKVKLNAINATIVDVKAGVVRIETAVGDVEAKLDRIEPFLASMNATITNLIVNSKGEILARIQAGETTILAKLDAINATIIAVKDDVALIKTAVGTIESDVNEIKELVGSAESAIITKIENETATIQLKIGSSTTEIKASVSALEPKIKEVKDGVATVDTKIGTLQADVSTIKDYTKTIPDAVSGLVAPIWAAVILSLIAAIAAIYAVITIHRKIAG